MSVSVLAGPLASLIPKLAKLLHSQYKLQKGVKKQVKWLHNELEIIHAFLGEVSKVPWDQLHEQVKVWVREVREASYDIEDVIDTYLVHVDGGEPADPSKLKCAMKKMVEVFTKAKARRGIAADIEDIKKHLEDITERHQRYKLDDIMSKQDSTTSKIDPRLKAMHKEVTQLIGMDMSSEDVISLLNPSHTESDVFDKKIMKKVSIVGVGGLGKTTLAKAVYDKLRSQYDCGAFVSVGRDRDLAMVFKDILFQLDKHMHQNIHNAGIGVDLLISELRDFLENKRYFIVIDDVWDVDTWEAIKLSLVEKNCGSIVITTTRKFDVANEAGDVYKLQPLSRGNSMKLFYTRIFGAEGKGHDNQPEDVINKIIKKCGGIPLAILTMASLMAGKEKYEWSEVLDSIGIGSEGNREAEETMKILSYSYDDLPPHLRTCLLYVSTYLEDYEIKKDSLIWKWIAEGFVNGKQGTRSFEIGERYFNDLINRSLIQAVEKWDGIVVGCRVHDMVLDLMRKIASEENFIAILGYNVEGTPALSKVRRLTQHNRIAEHINSEPVVTGMPKVRSYTAFNCFIDSWDQFLGFKILRVLDIEGCNFNEGCGLEYLGDLLHLRYLGINCQDYPPMPEQLGNLKLLQTLDVHGSLPASIVHLTELVRVWAWIKVPDGICLLVSLEELRIRDGYCDRPERFVKELGRLRELRQHLEWSLIKFSKFPSCINPSCLANLSNLELAVTTMDEQDLNLLARLPALSHLELETQSTVTLSNINASDGSCFQKLRYFEVNIMVLFEQPNQEDASVSLHIWNGQDAMTFASRQSNGSSEVVPSGVMPNLEVLDFNIPLRALKDRNGDCGNIGVEYLSSLREIRGSIYCDDVNVVESDAALAALRNACKLHPNNPTLSLYKFNEMVSTHDKEDEKQRQEEVDTLPSAAIELGKLSLASS